MLVEKLLEDGTAVVIDHGEYCRIAGSFQAIEANRGLPYIRFGGYDGAEVFGPFRSATEAELADLSEYRERYFAQTATDYDAD